MTGTVADKAGKVHGIINGTWDEFIEYAPVESNTPAGESSESGGFSKAVLVTGQPVQLWRVSPLPAEAEKMYNFTQFAVQLNDAPSLEVNLCPTDCRLRPDQRLMEEGRWDEANAEKARLEDKQRFRRREMALKLVASDSNTASASDDTANAGTTATNTPLPASLMGRSHRDVWRLQWVGEALMSADLNFTIAWALIDQ